MACCFARRSGVAICGSSDCFFSDILFGCSSYEMEDGEFEGSCVLQSRTRQGGVALDSGNDNNMGRATSASWTSSAGRESMASHSHKLQ